MRRILILLVACGGSSTPTDPHKLVACDSPTFGHAGTCEAGCAKYIMGQSLFCTVAANDAGVSSCIDAFYFDGVEGCCEHVVGGVPVFTECQ